MLFQPGLERPVADLPAEGSAEILVVKNETTARRSLDGGPARGNERRDPVPLLEPSVADRRLLPLEKTDGRLRACHDL